MESNPPDNSHSLQPTQQSNFQQNFDWGQLVLRSVSFTVDLLSRYCGAGIDAYTVQVGQAISSRFELSVGGRDNISTALSNLGSYGALGDALWLGFGARHIVRSLPSTDQGFMCLALCGVLSEFYHENISAEILYELVKTLAAPPELTPSILQWKALVSSCAGVLAMTPLGVLINNRVQLNPYQRHQGIYSPYTGHPILGSCASPKSVAEALVGIGNVSKGLLAAITVVGGNDAGWLGAISEWLFDLRVSIRSSEGVELHTNCRGKEPHIIIIYEPGDSDSSRQLQTIGRTYTLPDATQALSLRPLGHNLATTSGRVPWSAAFTTVFGGDFQSLLLNTQTLGTAIGSAARMLRGIACAEKNIGKAVISSWTTYVHGSYGKSYVQNIIDWFPELVPSRHAMHEAVCLSFVEAKTTYENQILKLKQNCHCTVCSPTCGDNPDDAEKFCYVVLVETFLTLGLALSQMVVPPDLLPKKTGIESVYHTRASLRRQVYPPVQFSENLHCDVEANPEKSVAEMQLGPFHLVVLDAGSQFSLKRCLQIFNGFQPEQSDRGVSAMSDSGVCAYLGVLHGLTDTVDLSGKIHVVPGNIEWQGKPYHCMRDNRDLNSPQGFKENSLESLHLYSSVTAAIAETTTGLDVCFEIAKDEEPRANVLRINPSEFVGRLGQFQGLSPCIGTNCRFTMDVPSDTNYVQLSALGEDVRLFKGEKLSRCLALYMSYHLGFGCLLRKDECIQCCLRAAIDHASTPFGGDEISSRRIPWLIVSSFDN